MSFFLNIINGLGGLFSASWMALPAALRSTALIAFKGLFALVMKWQFLVLIPILATTWAVVEKPAVRAKLSSIEGFVSNRLEDIHCLAVTCGDEIFDPPAFFQCVGSTSGC